MLAGAYNYRLKQIDTDGSFEYSYSIDVYVGMPKTFVLQQNYPNPFNPTTLIEYEIPGNQVNPSENLDTRLTIYNLLGAEVRTLVSDKTAPGFYSVPWNGRDNRGVEVPTGVYIYRLQAGKFTDTKKMLLVR